MTKHDKGTLTIYGVGGAGINLTYMFEAMRNGEQMTGMANIDPVYADTSKSNLRQDIPSEAFFHFKDYGSSKPVSMDGSGGIRATNAAAIQEQIEDFVQAHKPGYAAVIIHSGSGGSGSVIGPVLARHLRAMGHEMVISIVVGDATAGTRIKNTMNTNASYELIAEELEKSMTVAYFENDHSKTRSDVDSEVFQLITQLAALFSRENAELDTMDIIHFLNVDKVAEYAPHLIRLQSCTGDLNDGNIGEGAATVATLLTDRDNNPMTAMVDHPCVGYRPANNDNDVLHGNALHFVTRVYAFNGIADRLRQLLKEREAVQASNVKKTTLTQGVVRKGSGLVL